MDQLGLDQKQLAIAAGVDQSTLSKVIRGIGGYSREFIEKVAKALYVSVGVLFADGLTVEMAGLGARRIPIIPESMVHDWLGLDHIDGDWDRKNVLFSDLLSASRHAFALRIAGGKNSSVLEAGDMAIFDLGMQPWPAAVVVATDYNKHVHIGRLRILQNDGEGDVRFEVVPANSFYPPISSTQKGGLTLKGIMIEQRRYWLRP